MCERVGISQQDHKRFKKVNSFEEHGLNKLCVSNNVLQNIEHLKRALNYEDISVTHILSFCDDEIDQILYISETKSKKITIIF